MARTRTSKRARAALTIGIVGILAAVVYLTKPGPGTASTGDDPAGERAGRGDDAKSSDSHHAVGSFGEIAEEDVEPARGSGPEAADEDEDDTTASAGTGQATPPSARHGEDAVVRAGENLSPGTARKRPTGTPDWSSPTSLGFRDFKKLRRQFRRAGDFTPDELSRLHGAAVTVRGALMPIDPVPESGKLERFWLANPIVVMAGCVFCNPPTMADLIYVRTNGDPLEVDRERLYRSVVYAKLLGRFELGPGKSPDGVEYMFGMDLEERKE